MAQSAEARAAMLVTVIDAQEDLLQRQQVAIDEVLATVRSLMQHIFDRNMAWEMHQFGSRLYGACLSCSDLAIVVQVQVNVVQLLQSGIGKAQT